MTAVLQAAVLINSGCLCFNLLLCWSLVLTLNSNITFQTSHRGSENDLVSKRIKIDIFYCFKSWLVKELRQRFLCEVIENILSFVLNVNKTYLRRYPKKL